LSIIKQAKVESAEFYRANGDAVRRIVLAQMVISTVLPVALLLLGTLPALRVLKTPPVLNAALSIAVAYLTNVATLAMISRLATLPKETRVRDALRAPSLWVASLVTPAFTVLALTPIILFFNGNGIAMLVLVLNFFEPYQGSQLWKFLGMMEFILVFALVAMVYMASYVCTSRLMIRRAATNERLTGEDVKRAIREGIRQALTPAILFSRHIGYFALIYAGVVELLLGGAVFFAPWVVRGGPLSLLINIYLQWDSRPWLFGMLLVVGYTWCAGFAAWFWPEYRLTHVMYQKRLMREGKEIHQ